MKLFDTTSRCWQLLYVTCVLIFSYFNLVYFVINVDEIGQMLKLVLATIPKLSEVTFYLIFLLGFCIWLYVHVHATYVVISSFKLLINKIKSRNNIKEELNYTHLYKDTSNYVRLGGYQPIPNNTLINPLPPKNL
jgi:hypothetical protein